MTRQRQSTGVPRADGSSGATTRRRFLRATGAAGVAGLTGLAGCSGGGGGGGTITLGQPALLSGNLQAIQPPVSASADMAVRKINQADGPLGREIEIVRRDTERSPQTAREVFNAFIEQDDVATINGFTSTVVQPNWEFILNQQVPIVSMYAGTRFLDTRGGDGGTPGDTSDDGWFWRTTGADSQHATAAAIHTNRATADGAVVGAIHNKTSGSTTWAETFLSAIGVLDGVEAGERVPVDSGQSAYRSELDSFYESDADVLGTAMGVPSATTLIRNWSDGGYGGNLMLSNPLRNPDTVSNVGQVAAEMDGWMRVSVPAISGPYASDYRSELSSFVGRDDNDYASDLAPNNWSASSYDSITLSALAIHAADSTDHTEIQSQIGRIARPGGTKVQTFADGKEALDAGEEIDYVGAQTTVDFNEFGDVFNQARIFEVTSDGFTENDSVSAERIRTNLDAQRSSN
ncbi:ABC transporter substrate-binding protein [Halobaculum sp. MBLA0147]|uniref:ABC transporter substrate-binding protein n=1 Tax=Halobaculum sp. MBLA0147 TaxID=3079934 RepID=UPI0035265F14